MEEAWGGLKKPPHEVAYCACRFTYATAVMPAEKTNGTTAPPEATAVRGDCPRAAEPTPVVSPDRGALGVSGGQAAPLVG